MKEPEKPYEIFYKMKLNDGVKITFQDDKQKPITLQKINTNLKDTNKST